MAEAKKLELMHFSAGTFRLEAQKVLDELAGHLLVHFKIKVPRVEWTGLDNYTIYLKR